MKTLAQIQAAVKTAQSQYDQAQGQLTSATEALQAEFGVKTRSAALNLEKKLQAELEAADAAFQTALQKFAEDFPELAQ